MDARAVSRSILSFGALAMVTLPATARAGPRLDSVRSEVSGSSSSGSSSSSSFDVGDDDDDHYDATDTTAEAWTSTDGSAVEPQPDPRLARYPYADDAVGFHAVTGGRVWMGRVSAESAYLFDGLWRFGGAARFDGAGVWGVDTSLSGYLERSDLDVLWLGDVHLGIDWIRFDAVRLRTGLGGRYMVDPRTPGHEATGAAGGVDSSIEVDVLPAKPAVLSLTVNLGSLGHALVARARFTAGVLLRRVELYGGFDVLVVGDVPLGGPVLGLRMWL